MTGRAGRALREEARDRRRQCLSRNRWPVAGFVRFELLVLLPLAWVMPRGARGFYLGAAVSSIVWLVVILVRDYSGSHRAELGATGEENTAAVLRKLERGGWRVVHDVEFDGFNVDHVAIGPGGIYAIETKNASAHWNITSTRDGQYLAAAVGQARFGARKIRLLLKEVGDFDVKPMLICWGAGIDDLSGGLQDGVLVVVGRQAHEVLTKVDAERLDPFTIDCAAERIETFVQTRDGYHRRRAERRFTASTRA
jgi:hypothetical protein